MELVIILQMLPKTSLRSKELEQSANACMRSNLERSKMSTVRLVWDSLSLYIRE